MTLVCPYSRSNNVIDHVEVFQKLNLRISKIVHRLLQGVEIKHKMKT